MNIELLNKYEVIEWVWNYLTNIELLNEYRIIEWKTTNRRRLILILNIHINFEVKEMSLNYDIKESNFATYQQPYFLH